MQTRLRENISSVTADPTAPLEKRLFDEAELVLAETLSPEQRQSLVVELSTLLQTIQQDPTPVVNLLLRLVKDFSYADVLSLGSVPFTQGLAVGAHMSSFNRLILALLRKATFNAADAASVAGMQDTMLALVRLWLWTDDTGVAGQCSELLLDLLKVDQEIQTDPDAHLPTGGQGLVWKRIFGDRDVYTLFFAVCSATGPQSVKPNKTHRTLAQARLMEWLPKVGTMDWNTISKSHHPDVESSYGLQPDAGLLDFAALHMVDFKDDVLMHVCLIDFYSNILRISPSAPTRLVGSSTESQGLLYLIAQGVHTRTAALYLQLPGAQLDPVDLMFTFGPAANYIATYASHYPEHFLASQLPSQILVRLSSAFDKSAGEWAHAESPKHDLHLLASLPRRTLLGSSSASFPSSPLSLLPTKSTNPDVLNTLATLFHGPQALDIVVGGAASTTTQSQRFEEETTAARALYFQYLAHNPTLWSNIATHADTVALKELALAAINVVHAVITSNWTSSPSRDLPTSIATPAQGHVAILTPPALEYALPYLLKPPQTFSNLVGGRGDSQGSAYLIAAAKFEALTVFMRRLQTQVEQQPGEGYEDILATVRKRVAVGPYSREGEVGGQIATMEM